MEGGERAAAGVSQQPHRFGSSGGVGGSEFFICFTSRPSSSSSMRMLSSKSLPSPGRADKYRDPAAAAAAPSLSASLSRRLKNSGSVKGGQSPATIPGVGGSRKKGCTFEAAEPSSPKVTCIGQVKVKTARMKKKKTTTLRSSSKRATRSGGEATFRRLEQRGGDLGEDKECLPNRNQRWVHLPLTSICDALRAFGSEFNCFLPCGSGGRSQCSSAARGEREKGERAVGGDAGTRVDDKRARAGGMGSCGAAFARWLMAIQETEGVKRGEMVELVVEEVEGRGMARELRGMDLLMDVEKGGLGTKEERQGAVLAAVAAAPDDDSEAVCVPPPNALLLMRCRSDPVRMAALANRFWGSPAKRVEVEEEEDQDEEDEVGNKEEDTGRLIVQDGEEPGETAGKGDEGGAHAVATASVAETVLREDQVGMADQKSLGICVQDGEGGGEEEEQLQRRPCYEKGERDGGDQRRAEATTEMNNISERGEEQGAKLEEAAAKKEAAGLTGSHPPVSLMEKKEGCLPLAIEEEEAGQEEVPSKPRRSSSFSAERQHGRRPSFSSEKEEGRRCKEKEGRRHSFSTEKEARRTGSGRRSSFSVEGDALRSTLRAAEGEGRRRWSFSSEKEVRRPPLVETAAEAAVVMGLGPAGDKNRKKKKKKKEGEGEGEEAGEPRAEAETEARRFDGPTSATTAAAGGEGDGEMGRRGDKRSVLPDCLLLMMYEPKLSMEVSRETWVCTSDFLRFRPHQHRPQLPLNHQPNQTAAAAQGGEVPAAAGDGCKGESKPLVNAGSDAAARPHPSTSPPPPPAAPPAACSPVPAAASPPAPPPETLQTAEPKLAPSMGVLPAPASASPYGPFGLTRCKSEPMRSTAKLEPDACFWKSRHQPMGAAGIGF